jgi:CRP/FNR family transcriptional regulator
LDRLTFWAEKYGVRESARYPRGATLFRHGDPIRTLFALTTGLVKLTVPGHECEVPVGVQSSGALLGGTCAVLGGVHLTSASVLQDALVLPIGGADFHRLLEDPEVSRWLNRRFAQELHGHQSRVAELASGGKRGSLECTIEDLFRRAGERHSDGSMWLRAYLTVEELAGLSQTTRQWATRAIHELTEAGTLHRSASGWFVLPTGSSILRRILRTGPGADEA